MHWVGCNRPAPQQLGLQLQVAIDRAPIVIPEVSWLLPAAMLTVADEAFWETATPVVFGQLPRLQEAVSVIG